MIFGFGVPTALEDMSGGTCSKFASWFVIRVV